MTIEDEAFALALLASRKSTLDVNVARLEAKQAEDALAEFQRSARYERHRQDAARINEFRRENASLNGRIQELEAVVRVYEPSQ